MFVRKKAAATLGASLIALSAITAVPADADAASLGKGSRSDDDGPYITSTFYHPKKRHGAAVQGVYYADSGCVGKKKWAHASAPRAWWGGNRAWHYFC